MGFEETLTVAFISSAGYEGASEFEETDPQPEINADVFAAGQVDALFENGREMISIEPGCKVTALESLRSATSSSFA